MGYVRRQDILNTLPKEYHRLGIKYGSGINNINQSGGALYLPTRKDYSSGDGIGETMSSIAKFIGDNKVVISAVSSAATAGSTSLDIFKKVKELQRSGATNDDLETITKSKSGKGFYFTEK